MAAIKKPKALTEGALQFDKPLDLDDALLRIEMLSAAIEVGLTQIERQQETIDEKSNEIDELKGAVREANERADDEIMAVVEDLERARQWVTVGKTADALHQLTRILQDFDPTCQRFTVVAPMLPMPAAGSFGS